MQNRNMSINQDMNRIFDLKGESTDIVSDYIQPVINISRVCNIIRRGELSNGTAGTIFITPTDKDFYLVGSSLNVIKDVTATSLSTHITASIEGVSVRINQIIGITLTVQNQVSNVMLSIPIKVDRGTTIQLANNTGNANISSHAIIFGYTVETTKGQ